MVSMKLVRDNIPQIIKSEGRTCKFFTANAEQKKEFILKKLVEEAEEVVDAAKNGTAEEIAEEVADVMTVIYELLDTYGVDRTSPIDHIGSKGEKKGFFKAGFILEEIDGKSID